MTEFDDHPLGRTRAVRDSVAEKSVQLTKLINETGVHGQGHNAGAIVDALDELTTTPSTRKAVRDRAEQQRAAEVAARAEMDAQLRAIALQVIANTNHQ